jgi:hypothetical protein
VIRHTERLTEMASRAREMVEPAAGASEFARTAQHLTDMADHVRRLAEPRPALHEVMRDFPRLTPHEFLSSIEQKATSIAADLAAPASGEPEGTSADREQLSDAIAEWASEARESNLNFSQAIDRLDAMAQQYPGLQHLWNLLASTLMLVIVAWGNVWQTAPQQRIRAQQKIADDHEMVTTHYAVRIYHAPKRGSRLIGTLPSGVIVERQEKRKEWIRVEWTDKHQRARVGWVRSKYLRHGK